MQYQYIASTRSGKIRRGVTQAASKDEVVKQLQSKNLLIVSVQPFSKKAELGAKTGLASISFGRISILDKVIFARHLSVMLRSGLSLVEALDIIQEQASTNKAKMIFQSIKKSVTNGANLAASFSQYPKVFSNIFIGMVRVGEASGTLERNLEYIASELEKDYELRKKVRSAMIYPTIVLSATFILGTGLTIFILPKLVDMFNSFRMELPILTKIFLGLANFLVDYGIFVLIGIVGLIILFRLLVKAKFSKPFFHKLYLKLPVVKGLSKSTNLTRLTRVLAILLKSGVTINEGLEITASVMNNVHYQREVQRAIDGIQKGQPLSTVLTDEDYISKMANKMIAVGEKTGKLEDSLFYLADFYEEEVDNTTKNLSTIIEPILLIIIGVVLGLLAVSIISPIYQFTGSLQR